MSFRDLRCPAAFGVFALLAGTTYLYSGSLRRLDSLPYEAPEWFLGSFGIAGAVVNFAVGTWRSPSVQPQRRLTSGLGWAVAWCVLLMSPVLVRYFDLLLLAHSLPIPPAADVAVSIDPVKGDGLEDCVVTFTPSAPPAEVVRFYEVEMRRRGWEPDLERLDETRRFHEAGKSGQTNVRFEQGWRVCVFRINVYSPGNEPRVNVMLLSPEWASEGKRLPETPLWLHR